MSGWTGFTDAELKKMKEESDLQSTDQAEPIQQVKPENRQQNQQQRNHRQQNLEQKKQLQQQRLHLSEPHVELMHQQQQVQKKRNFPRWEDAPKPNESKTLANDCTNDPKSDTNESKQNVPLQKSSSKEEGDQDHSTKENDLASSDKSEEIPKGAPTSDEAKIHVLSDSEQQKLLLTNLEQLQKKQKEIEDENKKKQKVIQQTLQERFKQAQSESQKLKGIHKQLKGVDAEFQADVEDLRDKIDEACLQFSFAQKRYKKAEKEYVESKLDYFHKKEVKDELTEQLYAIIQENEIKKAKKLEELMTKLSTDANIEAGSPTSNLETSGGTFTQLDVLKEKPVSEDIDESV